MLEKYQKDREMKPLSSQYPLNRVIINGFKSIRRCDLPLSALNILIGANGAGKSNFIEFFRLLKNIVKDNLDDHILSGGGISDYLFHGRKTTSHIEAELWFGGYGYRFKLKPAPSENARLADEACFDEHGAALPCGDTVYNTIDSWRVYHFHDTSATAAMRHYEIVQDNNKLRSDAANIAPYLLRLKNEHADAYREILDSIRLVAPFFDDFLLVPTDFGEKRKVNLSWRQKGSDYPMQPYHLSDGAIRFICLATALLGPNPPATIIIDEPELGQHPSALAILAELIQNASKRTQLIAATQSPALIDYFSVEDVIVVNRKSGTSTFERLREKDFNVWLETYSVGELWSKNVISGGPVHE